MYRSPSDDASIVVVGYMGRLTGLERATGERRWSCVLEGSEGPIEFLILGGHIYAAAHPANIYCIDYRTGAIVWQAEAFPPNDKGKLLRPSLIVDGDQLFVMSRWGELACFALNGELRWRHSVRDVVAQGWWTHMAPSLGLPGNVRQPDVY